MMELFSTLDIVSAIAVSVSFVFGLVILWSIGYVIGYWAGMKKTYEEFEHYLKNK
jgi:hypothetical protein